MNGVQEAKLALARTTKRGFPIILAGLLFWLAAGASAFFLPERVVLWVYVVGIGAVFPLGIFISKMMNIDLFAKGNSLGSLAGMIGGMHILFAPIIITLIYNEPRWMPYFLGVLNGAHFLPYVWVYNSKSYLFLSVATTVVATVTGLKYMSSTFTITPFAIAVVFFISLIGIYQECKNDVEAAYR